MSHVLVLEGHSVSPPQAPVARLSLLLFGLATGCDTLLGFLLGFELPCGFAIHELLAGTHIFGDLVAPLVEFLAKLLFALATIVEDPLEQVFVAVYDVTDEDATLLDGWESADSGLYRKTKVRVTTMLGEQVAWAYVLDAYEGGLPSARYLGEIADAAESAGAPHDYVMELRKRPC